MVFLTSGFFKMASFQNYEPKENLKICDITDIVPRQNFKK